MPVDPASSAPPVQRPKTPAKTLPAKTLNDADFGALVNQNLKSELRPGPKMTPATGDGFKSTIKEPRFLPLNRAATGPADAKSVDALGAATKHPLGPQKR
ncbi:MAG: hypothetical protein K1X51_08995 [Rhodospirillaceae bacterium]|nr:hypothetical protein [Rhodospirillaceae bacterium]